MQILEAKAEQHRKQGSAYIGLEENKGLNDLPAAILAGLH